MDNKAPEQEPYMTFAPPAVPTQSSDIEGITFDFNLGLHVIIRLVRQVRHVRTRESERSQVAGDIDSATLGDVISLAVDLDAVVVRWS